MTLAGSKGVVYGGTGSANVVDSGTDDSVGGFTGALAVTISGSGSGIYASSASLVALLSGNSDTINGGSGAISATLAGSADVVGASSSATVLEVSAFRAVSVGIELGFPMCGKRWKFSLAGDLVSGMRHDQALFGGFAGACG